VSSDAIRFLYLPDSHGTYADPEAVSCALRFGRLHKPQIVILGGDHVDFYQLSSFDKNPQRMQGLQDDIDAGAAFVRQVRHSFKDARIFYLQGNHEDRLRRFIWKKGPELKSLRSMNLPSLLGLGESRVQYKEDGVLQIRRLTFKHGNAVRQLSGYTAHAEMQREGTSGVSGHTHRISEVSKTDRSGTYKWVESGCLCSLRPEYMPGQVPNWQQGLSYGAFAGGSDRFSLSTAHIIKGKTMYGDRVVTA
jgi:predicted phosphodiesterase